MDTETSSSEKTDESARQAPNSGLSFASLDDNVQANLKGDVFRTPSTSFSLEHEGLSSDYPNSKYKRKWTAGAVSPGKKQCPGPTEPETPAMSPEPSYEIDGENDANYATTELHLSPTNDADSFLEDEETSDPVIDSWLESFLTWSPDRRRNALTALVSVCDASQIVHLESVIEPHFTRDFISLLPKELALHVLSFLEPADILITAQISRTWRTLSEDTILWQEKCEELGILDSSLPKDLTSPLQSPNWSSNIDDDVNPPAPSSELSGDPMFPFADHNPTRQDPGSSPKDHPPSRSTRGTMVGPMCAMRCAWKAAFMRHDRIDRNWRRHKLREPKKLRGHDEHVITCLQLHDNIIVSGSDDNTLKVWDALTGQVVHTLVGHTGGVWSSEVSTTPALRVVISGSTDRTVRVWDLETGACRHTLVGHTSTVRCMALSDTTLVSGSRDQTLRVWDAVTGECLRVLCGHLCAVRCVAFDGRRIVSGAYDWYLKVWDSETGACVHTLMGHQNRVYSLQFDPTQDIVVSGSLDTTIRVWNVRTGDCINVLVGHKSLNSDIQLRKNILVSGNADATIKVWDIFSGACLHTLAGPQQHQSSVTCLQYLESGLVITSSDDGTVKLWDAKSGEFVRNLVELESGMKGGVVWRIRASPVMLVCAVGSRGGIEDTKLIVMDFDAGYP